MTRCSIIIPAHNEETVIGRCLDAILKDAPRNGVEIIVSCNGCRDRTAEIAREYGDPVRVVETNTASKATALNLGDKAASAFPRLYVDADVVMDWRSIEAVVVELNKPGVLAAAPTAETDLTGVSWPVRAFYRVWTRTDYFRSGMIGCGVYGLSEEGRRRFDEFPPVIADDGFVRSRFVGDERRSVTDARVVVYAPRTLSDLIRGKTRSRLGRYELASHFSSQVQSEQAEKRYLRSVVGLIRDPRSWISLPWYLGVNLVVRYRARRQYGRLGCYNWERDESSRQVVAS